MLDLIKGRRVEDALNTLAFTKKRIAAKVEKLLRSAVENANYLSTEKNVDVDLDNLRGQVPEQAEEESRGQEICWKEDGGKKIVSLET